MNKCIPSAALCAHLHDIPCRAGQEQIDALVSTIYASSRKIEICKEIAYLAKAAISQYGIDLQQIHHLPLVKGQNGVAADEYGIPYLHGKSYELVDKLLHMPTSAARDMSLTLLTKLHGMVLPLELREATCRTTDMFKNIESPFDIDPNIVEKFRRYVRKRIKTRLRATITVDGESIKPYDTRWYMHLEPLHALGMKYYTSTKKRPHMSYNNGIFGYLNNSQMCEYDAYVLPCILTNSHVRPLYLRNKEDFLTLVTGKPVSKVLNDDGLLRHQCVDAPIGRTGIRLQEAEKIRLLWMNLAVFECLTQPGVDALEFLVRTSPHQSAYLDDEKSSECIKERYFPKGVPSSQLIYSIDQSNFTDNFPYVLQRVVLEELHYLGVMPKVTLEAFDLEVTGPYLPDKFFSNYQKEVRFAKGTPMGAYGLWMLSTITHELLIEMIQDICHHTHDEFVQGDDAIIVGEDVYALYCDYLSRLGTTVNQQKTMKSYRAVEYCGWITTTDMSCPMFRPHDRYNDLPRDVVSPRAVKAFGLDNITDWLYANRSGILDQLRVYGLIPISEDDTVLLSARAMYEAVQKVQEIAPSEITSDHRRLLFDLQEYYPDVEYDPFILAEMQRNGPAHPSDLEEFEWKVHMMSYYRKQLLTNTNSHIFHICERILVLYDDIMLNHGDRIDSLREHRNMPTKSQEERIPSFLRDRKKLRESRALDNHEQIIKAAKDNTMVKSSTSNNKELSS